MYSVPLSLSFRSDFWITKFPVHTGTDQLYAGFGRLLTREPDPNTMRQKLQKKSFTSDIEHG